MGVNITPVVLGDCTKTVEHGNLVKQETVTLTELNTNGKTLCFDVCKNLMFVLFLVTDKFEAKSNYTCPFIKHGKSELYKN